jgi:hypothetical protein
MTSGVAHGVAYDMQVNHIAPVRLVWPSVVVTHCERAEDTLTQVPIY